MYEPRDSKEITGRRELPSGLGVVPVVVRAILVIPS
jgi:hypothetical protein